MIVIEKVLVSDNIVEKRFVCDLSKCKGGCCEDGDAGAPLEKEEIKIIENIFDQVKPYLDPHSVKEIEAKGKYVYNREFGWVTTTVDSDAEICVYGIRDKDGVIKCAFEQAFNDGKTRWKKPISCHLFPVIAKKGKHGDYEMVNYEAREGLCNPACELGKQLKIPTYRFLKEALIRKFGEAFYEALDKIAQERYHTAETSPHS